MNTFVRPSTSNMLVKAITQVETYVDYGLCFWQNMRINVIDDSSSWEIDITDSLNAYSLAPREGILDKLPN